MSGLLNLTLRPKDLDQFAFEVDKAMISKNIYYKDLIAGKILRPLVIRLVAKGGFKSYMKSIGKLGGQNKVPQSFRQTERLQINSIHYLIYSL